MTHKATFQPDTFSQLSHELRIPLTGILGMGYFLGQTALDPQQQEYLQTMLECAHRLTALEAKIHVFLENRKI